MPVGLAVFVRLRGWIGALVLATAGVSRDTAGGIYDGDAAPGIPYGEILRAKVYGVVRTAGGDAGQLAGAAESEASADGARGTRGKPGAGADWTGRWRCLGRNLAAFYILDGRTLWLS